MFQKCSRGSWANIAAAMLPKQGRGTHVTKSLLFWRPRLYVDEWSMIWGVLARADGLTCYLSLSLSLSLSRKGHIIDGMGVAVAFILHEKQEGNDPIDLRRKGQWKLVTLNQISAPWHHFPMHPSFPTLFKICHQKIFHPLLHHSKCVRVTHWPEWLCRR